MLHQNDRIEVIIDSLANGGDAVGKHRGQAVFIPYGVPGDTVRAVVTRAYKTYAKAAITDIKCASAQRIDPLCPYFGECGSCQWQMMDYHHQITYKEAILSEVLRKLSGLEIPTIVSIPSPKEWNYRNKAQYPVADSRNGIISGYYRKGSHTVVPVARCLLLMEPINLAFEHVRNVIARSKIIPYDEKTGKGRLRHILLRCNGKGDEISLTLVMTDGNVTPGIIAELMAYEQIKSVWLNINTRRDNVILGEKWELLGGGKRLSEEIGEVRYEVSAGSFWQINQEVAKLVYQMLVEGLKLKGDEVAVDLYCGIGAIALQLAQHCRKVLGIEVLEQSVNDAAHNASINGYKNVVFWAGPAGEIMQQVSKADILVADPPRSGLEMGVIEGINRLKPTRIAYLSCDPATMARDISQVASLGYKIRDLWLADMFPQTYHIETLAIMERV